MKSKHLHINNLPLTIETYDELRKGLKLGYLKWSNFPKEAKTAYHNFDEDKRETDFEKQLHKITRGALDYDMPI
jgi:hypothetical protein